MHDIFLFTRISQSQRGSACSVWVSGWSLWGLEVVVFITTVDPWTTLVSTVQSTHAWIFFNKYLYCFRAAVGSPQMWRAEYALVYTILYRGRSISEFWYPQGSWKQSPTDTEGQLKFGGSQKLHRDFQLPSVVRGSTVLYFPPILINSWIALSSGKKTVA